MRLVGLAHRPVRNLRDLRWLEGTCFGRSSQTVEEPHLTEKVTVLHQGDNRFAAIDRLVRDGDAAAHDDVQRVGFLVLGEQDVTSPKRFFDGDYCEFAEDGFVDVSEQIDRSEK